MESYSAGKLRILVPVLAVLFFMAGCNAIVYDGQEGDCSVSYAVRLRMPEAHAVSDSALARELASVEVRVFDASGAAHIKTVEVDGQQLVANGRMVDLPLAPGEYSIMVWAGDAIGNTALPAADEHSKKFGDGNQSARDLLALWHGLAQGVGFTDNPEDEGLQVYDVDMTGCVKAVDFYFRHAVYETTYPADHSQLQVSIAGGDLNLGRDGHTLRRAGQVEFSPHSRGQQGPLCFSLPRLHVSSQLRVDIHNSKSGQDASFALIDYLTMLNEATGGTARGLSHQEFLDSVERYTIVMFLDEDGAYLKPLIQINGWQLHLIEAEL